MNIARFFNLSTSILKKNNALFHNQNHIRTCLHLEKCINRQYEMIYGQTRLVSTCEVKSVPKEEGIIKKTLKKIPIFNFHKLRITAISHILYENIVDQVKYVPIFEELDLPDTFYSWFVITELHIWMLSARAMAEETDGRYLRNGLLEALWLDVAPRVKKLGISSSTLLKQQVFELSEQLQAALLAYDEGLQSDDTVLAGALWRRFYQGGPVNPEHLAILVKNIRKQMALLDHIPSDQLFKENSVRWEPIYK